MLLFSIYQILFFMYVCREKKSKKVYIYICVFIYVGFPGSSEVKNLPAVQETQVQSLGWKDSLEKGMATHSSILA